MRKMLMVGLALAILTGLAMAQGGGEMKSEKKEKAASAPLKTLKGTLKAEGDKVTFVSDKDSKPWEVMNPEAVKGHEGHHVQLQAHVYQDKNSIHVMKVSMLPAGKSMGKDDTKHEEMKPENPSK